MGGDCCGGAATSDPAPIAAADAAQAQLADMRVNDAQSASKPNAARPAANGAAPPQFPAKSDADIAKEKEPYFQKRRQLFEKYRERGLQKLDEAKQTDVSIKGTHACLKLDRDMSSRRLPLPRTLPVRTLLVSPAGEAPTTQSSARSFRTHVAGCGCIRFCHHSAPHHACGACRPHMYTRLAVRSKTSLQRETP